MKKNMRIRDYCQQHNQNYSKVYRDYASGKLKGYKDENGSIVIGEKPNNTVSLVVNENKITQVEPLGANFEEFASTRSNKAAFQKPNDRFKHIDNALLPFSNGDGDGYGASSDVSVRDAIILCQKCYYDFSLFQTTIDLMTEFCVGKIHFKGGSVKSREFFNAFCNKLKIDWAFQDMFYRELFRSSNNFVFVIEGAIAPADLKKITQLYGTEIKSNVTIPIRYVILNPADIIAQGNISFTNTTYYKKLSDYELERLRNPKTPQDFEVLKSLSPEDQKAIKDKKTGNYNLPLSNKNIRAVFFKKQDYEAFAVPLGYRVLEDINFKKELRLMDQAIARTAQQAILLITMGAEPDKGGINPNALAKMQKMFENESVARVVIADYTTKASFVIPQIADILDPKKYEVVDKDIAIGLNNVLLGQGEKFANQHAKIEIFIEKLKHARQAFLKEFLIPEIKRIAENIGLKNYPEPYYEDIDLKNELEYSKIYTRLAELGILTPEETIKAIETGTLPTPEISEENQEKFKKQKDKGLYEPLLNKGKEDAGRPDGTKAPKKVKVGPISANVEQHYSLKKITNNLIASTKLTDKVLASLKEKFKLKTIEEKHESIAQEIVGVIIANETPEVWEEKIAEYVSNPVDKYPEKIEEINEIAAEKQVDTFTASILFHSKIDNKKE